MRRAVAAVALALASATAGCQSEKDVRKPFQEHLVVSGRILGFALDAQSEALHMKLALLEADPKLEAKLGSPEEVRKRLDRVQKEQLAIQAELKALKERYPLEGEAQ